MFVVRNLFVARPGKASALIEKFKEASAVAGIANYRILTDVTGDFNRVILEYEAETLEAFEAQMKDYQTNAAFREKMAGYTDLYVTGSRELLRVT